MERKRRAGKPKLLPKANLQNHAKDRHFRIPDRAVLDQIKDELSCPVCLSLLVDPRLLVCGHTACFSCLGQLFEESTITCPLCRHETIPADDKLKCLVPDRKAACIIEMLLEAKDDAVTETAMQTDTPIRCSDVQARLFGAKLSWWRTMAVAATVAVSSSASINLFQSRGEMPTLVYHGEYMGAPPFEVDLNQTSVASTALAVNSGLGMVLNGSGVSTDDAVKFINKEEPPSQSAILARPTPRQMAMIVELLNKEGSRMAVVDANNHLYGKAPDSELAAPAIDGALKFIEDVAGPCIDKYENVQECQNWAARGECDINPGFMIPNCRHSCKGCLLHETVQTTTSETLPRWAQNVLLD